MNLYIIENTPFLDHNTLHLHYFHQHGSWILVPSKPAELFLRVDFGWISELLRLFRNSMCKMPLVSSIYIEYNRIKQCLLYCGIFPVFPISLHKIWGVMSIYCWIDQALVRYITESIENNIQKFILYSLKKLYTELSVIQDIFQIYNSQEYSVKLSSSFSEIRMEVDLSSSIYLNVLFISYYLDYFVWPTCVYALNLCTKICEARSFSCSAFQFN